MTATVTNAATLNPQPELFERFRYQYEVLQSHLHMELSSRQFEAQLSFLSVPDARFNHLAAVKVCFCDHSWLIGGVAGESIDYWGIAAEGQSRVRRHDTISDVVTDLLHRVKELLQAKADRLKADWESTCIQADIAALIKERQFHWPDDLVINLYEWSWVYWIDDNGDKETFQRWSLVDFSNEDGYIPFISQWHSQDKEGYDLIKLPDSAQPIIKQVKVSRLKDLPSELNGNRYFTVDGVI